MTTRNPWSRVRCTSARAREPYLRLGVEFARDVAVPRRNTIKRSGCYRGHAVRAALPFMRGVSAQTDDHECHSFTHVRVRVRGPKWQRSTGYVTRVFSASCRCTVSPAGS